MAKGVDLYLDKQAKHTVSGKRDLDPALAG